MKDILVFGFPHSGTTILKELINRCDNAESLKTEATNFNSFKSDAEIKCIKYPFFDDTFLSEKFNEVNKIFIIRNPLYSLSSIQRRVGNLDMPMHSIKDWQFVARQWLDNQDKFICISYEGLFHSNNFFTKCLFLKLGLKFDPQIFQGYNFKYGVKESDHVAFRNNQILMPFNNMNTPDKITLSEEQQHEVMNTPEFKKIYV